MRNSELKGRPRFARLDTRLDTCAICSAFHVPRSAFGRGGEDPYRRGRHRRPSHARPRPRAGVARGAARAGAGAGGRRARARGARAPALSLPSSPAADRADLSPRVVAQRPLAGRRPARVARGGARARRRAAGDRARHGGLCGGARGVARAAARHPYRDPGAERVPGTHHALARASRPPGASRLSGGAQAATLARYAVPGRVVVRGFLDPMTTAYRAADLVVARAGAMTVAELCAWGKPSILVPLPTAAADHQTYNARAL